MTLKYQIRTSCEINVAASEVWARVSDHEATPSWVREVKKVTLSHVGVPKNGVGAERVVVFKPLLWSTIYEKITYFNEPHEFHYVLYKGMPGLVSHLGKVIVDDLGAGRCRLRWEVDFEFKTIHPFALIAPSFVKQFDGVLQGALLNLKCQVEKKSYK